MRWNLAVAALAAAWGAIPLIVVHVRLPAEALVFWRLAIGAAGIAAGIAAARRLSLVRVPRGLRLRVVAVGLVLGAHWFLFFETIKLASVAVALVTVYTAPIFLAVAAPLALPERRSRIALGALVPGAAGIALVAFTGGSGGHHLRPLGLVTGLGAAVTYAALVIGTKHLTHRLAAPTLQFWSYAVAAAALAPFLAFQTRVLPRGGEVGYVLVLGLVFTAVSGVVYVWLLRRVTAQAMGILSYLEPVSAALLAWAALGQALGAGVVAGGCLVLAVGAVVVVLEPSDAARLETLPAAEGRMLSGKREGV